MIDLNLFREILSIDSTSGNEAELMEFLRARLTGNPTGDDTFLLLSVGTPKVVFCTHMDTVPPYIPPTFHRGDGTPCLPQEAAIVRGRGACDAKGQLLAMLTACRELAAEGCTGFGLLVVTGEETGSWGAKAFAKTGFRAPYLIIGEPTENKMVSAAKGTKAYELTFRGEAFHSGYPQYGRSAVNAFIDFCNALRAVDFGLDPVLGETTWNIGRLASDNPQNILSPELTCRLYFRTTFVSDQVVQDWMSSVPHQWPEPDSRQPEYASRQPEPDSRQPEFASRQPEPDSRQPEYASRQPEPDSRHSRACPWNLSVKALGGDSPAEYLTLPGFETAPAAFGSDAPHLTNFEQKIICGPGSIRVAHRDDEQILVSDLEQAVEQYTRIYHALSGLPQPLPPKPLHHNTL